MCFSEGAQAHSSAYFGEGTGEIVRDDVDCNGTESQLIDCSASTTHNCGHYEDASVTCASKTLYYCLIIDQVILSTYILFLKKLQVSDCFMVIFVSLRLPLQTLLIVKTNQCQAYFIE